MQRSRIRTVTVAAGLVAVMGLVTEARSADPKPAWPQVNGPFGNFTPRRSPEPEE